MKRISLAILLILLIPSILQAEEHNPSRLHMGFIVGGGLSYIGTLGETPRWEPESLGYFAPCVTYYTPTGLAIRAEIAKLNRSSTMMDDTYYYQIREISSSSMHTPVTVLYPISKEDSLNRFYVGAGLYLDTIIKAGLYAEHDVHEIIRESIRDEYGPVAYGASLQLGVGLSKSFYLELRYLMDLSSFSAEKIAEYDLRTQSLMLRIGWDLTKYDLEH